MSQQRELIRVLVVDDSASSRQIITRMLRTSPVLEVVDVARDGEEALRKALEISPDLITLDLEMPKMDGFAFLRLLMAHKPTPVIVVSARAGDQNVFKALELGAVDFVAKPSSRLGLELRRIQDELIRKVHAARQMRFAGAGHHAFGRSSVPAAPARGCSCPKVVAIGSSTGGPSALMRTLSAFPQSPRCSVLIAQHMPADFTESFAARLDRMTPFRARQAISGDRPEPGLVLVAPGGKHMEMESCAGQPTVHIAESVAGLRYSPSVDRLFETAAKQFGRDLMAVVLTGMGDDGRIGVQAVKDAGGRVVAESKETAVVFGMPQQAIRTGCVDLVLPLASIPMAMAAGVGGAAQG